MKKILSYSRRRLIDAGIKPEDIKRVANPYDYPFKFENEHGVVGVVPMAECLPKGEYMKLLLWVETFGVAPQSCHSTAGDIALQLYKDGIDVKVVDGFYQRKSTGEVFAHTFCKIGDMYCCPTIEFAFGCEFLREFDYISERIFSAQEYFTLQVAMGYAEFNDISTTFHTSTLVYDGYWSNLKTDYILDKDGYLRSKTFSEIMEYYSSLSVDFYGIDDKLYIYTATTMDY